MSQGMQRTSRTTLTQEAGYRFEDFCVVTQAVRHGTPVEVEVAGLPPAASETGGST